MRTLLVCLLFAIPAAAQQPSADDAVRIAEFYRLAAQVQDRVWPGWSKAPAPLLLVTTDTEFLTHQPQPPKEFQKLGDDLYARPRQFPTNLLATFPAFGPPAAIVVGEPRNTQAKTSTPWLIVLMHEHFHQFQYERPGYYEALNDLGLSRGDKNGSWILNYPFPYEQPDIVRAFAGLRDRLLQALGERDPKKFRQLAKVYARERRRVFGGLSPDDHKYISFQIWQEGIARYVQIKAAEAAAAYEPTPAFRALPDYEPFSVQARTAEAATLDQLRRADLASMKREFVYAFGGAEGLLLDRFNPKWRDAYFRHLLTLDPLFDAR